MKRLPWRLLSIGVAVYLVGLIALFPASHALGLVAPRLESSGIFLAAHGVGGTLWSGRADSVSINGAHVGEVDWQLRLLPLLAGRLGIDWQTRFDDDGSASGKTRISLDGVVTTEALEAALSAEAAYARFPYLPIVPTGNLTIDLAELQLNNGRLTGAVGQVAWREAGLTVPQPVHFGEMNLRIDTSPEGEIIGHVSDGGGPLTAEGTMTLSPEGSYGVDLLLTPGAGAGSSLKQGLTLVGRPDARGRSRLRLNGRIQ